MTDTGDVLSKPVIIIGAPRSGTTILAEVLGAHPALAYAREPRLTWRFGNDRRSDMLRAEDARPEVRTHIRESFARFVTDQGASRLLEKTPSNALRPAFVDQVFPDCRFIHIVRDPYDCIGAIHRAWLLPPLDLRTDEHRNRLRRRLRETGWRRAPRYALEMALRSAPKSVVGLRRRPWGPRLAGLDGIVEDLGLVDACALQWKFCVEGAGYFGRQLPPERYIECRLEAMDLAAMQEILEFCELGLDPNVISTYERVFSTDEIQPRANRFDDAERARLATWVEPTAVWFGSDSSRLLRAQRAAR